MAGWNVLSLTWTHSSLSQLKIMWMASDIKRKQLKFVSILTYSRGVTSINSLRAMNATLSNVASLVWMSFSRLHWQKTWLNNSTKKELARVSEKNSSVWLTRACLCSFSTLSETRSVENLEVQSGHEYLTLFHTGLNSVLLRRTSHFWSV